MRAGGHEELHLSALSAPDHLGALWNHHSLCIGGEAEHPDPALVALREGGFNRLITSLGPTGNLYQRVYFNQAQSIFKRYFTMIFLSHSNLRLIIMTHKKNLGTFI